MRSGGSALVVSDQRRQAYFPRAGSSVARCHAPPSICTSTFAIGTGPPQAGPEMRYSHSDPARRRVIRATTDFMLVFEIDVSSHIGPSGVS